MFGLNRKQQAIDRSSRIMPTHIGIIMDGNGRWAKKHGLPRQAGHSVGARTFRTITRYCNSIGIKYLTIYAFSTENWSRPKEEVDGIMNLFRDYLKEALSDFKDENIKTRFIGDRSILAEDICQLMQEAEASSAHKTGLTLNIAINYGGRQEIIHAVKKIAEDISAGRINVNELSEEDISRRIYTAGQPDPDLIIRPSGEQRLSNFMLWQAAYSEFYTMDVLWPDFTTAHLEQSLDEYSRRNRRFGGI